MWNFGGLPSILYLRTQSSRRFRSVQLFHIGVIVHVVPRAQGADCLWNPWKRFPPEVAKKDEQGRILSNPSVHFILIVLHSCGPSVCPIGTNPVGAAALH